MTARKSKTNSQNCSKLIAGLEAILADEKKILKIIKDELLQLKKQYGDERRTKIIPQELGKMSDEDLVPDEQVVVTLTSANYVKRSPIAEYKKQGRGGKGRRGMATREEDVIEHVVNASTHDFLLFFTNKGRVFRLKTYEVPTVGLNAKGIALVNLLQLQPEETVSAVINISKQHNAANLIMCTVRGVVKKTPFEQYQNVRSSGLIAINLDEGDELKWIRMTNGDNEVADFDCARPGHTLPRKGRPTDGPCLARGARYPAAQRRPSYRHGHRRGRLEIFVISQYGYGKRTKVSQFTPHARGGVGIRSAVVNKKTGDLVGVKSLSETDGQEVIIISSQGQTIRLACMIYRPSAAHPRSPYYEP